MICQKNIAARGRGLFSLYIYIENFKKKFLSETTGLISTKIGRNVVFFWCPSTKIL